MKYTVIVGGNPYTVVADAMERQSDGVVRFWDRLSEDAHIGGIESVAEFNASKVDGIIFEDNNLED